MRRLALPLALLLAVVLAADARAQAGVSYSVPPDNPFVGVPGAAPEVWAYGLRNPFWWSFDHQTGDLTIGDVGLNKQEEIDFVPAADAPGSNFGWDCFEGTTPGIADPPCDPPNDIPPAYEYDHASPSTPGNPSSAITGGSVVRDPTLPAFTGKYLYSDFNRDSTPYRKVHSITLAADGGTDDQDTGLVVPRLTSFSEDSTGHLYVTSIDGPVFRLEQDPGDASLKANPVGNLPGAMYLATPPGDPGRLFVVERAGRIEIQDVGGGAPSTFLDISDQVSDSPTTEEGMLSMAFAPDYAVSGRFYVYYSDAAGDGDDRVDEFRRSAGDPGVADPASQRHVLTIPHPAADGHYGGQLHFGADGRLYISVGDGTQSATAQNLASLRGKILRIDPVLTAAAASRRRPAGAS